MFKRYFENFLLSLDMILGYLAVFYAYNFYLEKSADTISSLVLILTSLGYFIFYPYLFLKATERRRILSIATLYANIIKVEEERDYYKNMLEKNKSEGDNSSENG